MTTVILLGNNNPMMQYMEGEVRTSRKADHIYQSVTRIEMWEGFDDEEFVNHSLSTDNDRILMLVSKAVSNVKYAVGVHELEQIVNEHAGGVKPAWVRSSDPVFAAVLAKYYDCPQGEPVASTVFTNAGRDALHAQHIGTGTQPAAFNYGGLTANTGSGFAVTDTTLAGEIITPGGGLIRGQMTFAHTAGTNTSTLTRTWTVNGSDTLPVAIASLGTFNALTGGTLAWEDTLSATATLSQSGDSVTNTYTLTAG
jgi:hypothetical protein